MPRVIGPVDPAAPIDINISGMTPHVFAYKLWWRDMAHAEWTAMGEGSTGDQAPDFYQHACVDGGQIFYWIGIGGRANSQYDALIAIGQNGRIVQNGLIHVTGSTNGQGVDVQQDWMNFV